MQAVAVPYLSKGQTNFVTLLADLAVGGSACMCLPAACFMSPAIYMKDSSAINNFRPYVYDFDDFMGDKDWTKQFVTKLIRTHAGNCHSLPYLYKILCEAVGVKASLALGPNHVYVKHIDEKGQWNNVEMTSGGFPRDQWIIQQMGISVEAIKSGAYMTPFLIKKVLRFVCMIWQKPINFNMELINFY